jgi:uncharacterized surface protein with fasciclin (FAS1) repeats
MMATLACNALTHCSCFASVHQILNYHIIPSANMLSTHLKDGQKVRTSLQDATPLTVRLKCNKVDFVGAKNDARVTAADVKAGRDILVHIVDDLLLPEL